MFIQVDKNGIYVGRAENKKQLFSTKNNMEQNYQEAENNQVNLDNPQNIEK